MNVSLLKNAGVDYDGGVKRFMGRAQLYMKTLAKFPKDGTMERIRADYKAGDLAALLLDAHEFKGMCGNMSMTRLAGTADRLVSLLRSAAAPAALGDVMGELEKEYATVKDAVLTAMEASE